MWNDRYSVGLRLAGRATFDPLTGAAAATALAGSAAAGGTAAAGTAAVGAGSFTSLASMGMTAGGGIMSALSSLMGGKTQAQLGLAQQEEADSQADQLTENAAGEIGAAQRQALDAKLKASLTGSTARAGASAGGINAGTGSALTNQEQIGSRGEYQAAMDLWQGENKSTSDLNEANAVRFGGQIAAEGGQAQQTASELTAFSSLGAAGAKMADTYGAYAYGSNRGAVIPSVG